MDIILNSFLQVVDLFLSIYIWIIIARALVSWVNLDPYHPIVRFLYRTTEPVLAPFRRIIPPIAGIDITPAIVIFIIFLIKNLIHKLIAKVLI